MAVLIVLKLTLHNFGWILRLQNDFQSLQQNPWIAAKSALSAVADV